MAQCYNCLHRALFNNIFTAAVYVYGTFREGWRAKLQHVFQMLNVVTSTCQCQKCPSRRGRSVYAQKNELIFVGFFTVPNNRRPIASEIVTQALTMTMVFPTCIPSFTSLPMQPKWWPSLMMSFSNADSSSSFLPVRRYRCPISWLGRKMGNSSTLNMKAFTNSLLVKTRLSQKVRQDMWFPSKRVGIEDESRCTTWLTFNPYRVSEKATYRLGDWIFIDWYQWVWTGNISSRENRVCSNAFEVCVVYGVLTLSVHCWI